MKIKSLIVALCLISTAAQAETITHGGFGSDGASGLSIPMKRSAADAEKIYNVLKAKTDELGSKEISVKDGSSLKCKKPSTGVSGTVYAGCELVLTAKHNVKVKMKDKKSLRGDVTFSGDLARQIVYALDVNMVPHYQSYEKNVANLSCFSAPTVGQAMCTIYNTVVTQSNLETNR